MKIKGLKKKIICMAMTVTVAMGSLISGSTSTRAAQSKKSVAADVSGKCGSDRGTAEISSSLPSTTGKKIYIYSYESTLSERIKVILEKYPQYKNKVEVVDLEVGGTSDDYKKKIAKAMKTSKAPDIICWESPMLSYAMSRSYTIPLCNIGFSSSAYKKRAYSYTVSEGTYYGKLKAVTWKIEPGVYVYNNKKAKKIFGTSDPSKVSTKINSWSKFLATAKNVKKKGYKIVSSADEVSTPYIYGNKKLMVSGTTVYTQVANNCLDLTWKLYKYGYTNKTSMWDTDWTNDMLPKSKVLGIFGCPWFVKDILPLYVGNVSKNTYSICAGPSNYYWDDNFLTATSKCHNKQLTNFILSQLTCNDSISSEIYKKTGDVPNNKIAVARLIKAGYGKQPLIANNTLEVYDKVARKIPTTRVSAKSQYTALAVEGIQMIESGLEDKKLTASYRYEFLRAMLSQLFSSEGVKVKLR